MQRRSTALEPCEKEELGLVPRAARVDLTDAPGARDLPARLRRSGGAKGGSGGRDWGKGPARRYGGPGSKWVEGSSSRWCGAHRGEVGEDPEPRGWPEQWRWRTAVAEVEAGATGVEKKWTRVRKEENGVISSLL